MSSDGNSQDWAEGKLMKVGYNDGDDKDWRRWRKTAGQKGWTAWEGNSETILNMLRHRHGPALWGVYTGPQH